jgi:hypothetical protein
MSWEIIWFWFRENGRGVLLSLVLFAAICAFLLLPLYLIGPVLSRDHVQGTIVSVMTYPTNPKLAAGRGFRYEYGIRLDGERVVFARGPIAKPHAVGEVVFLTRSIHENGHVSYRFVDALSYQ